jgi:NADH-quinone oxidoreductase subunit L
VSALIHAATMVTAGIFLLCRAHVFLDVSSDAGTVVAWVGGVTALLAGTVAIMQPDIKRVLAYSTISQLGYMFLAVGIHAYSAAVFMVICHAFYKGCLFLGAGSVIHGNHDNQDMRIMGRFRKFLPFTAFGMVIAWLAIVGLPPLSGFFSKDEIITSAFLDHDYGLWIVALIAAVFTGFYMTRLIFLTFYGNERWQPTTEAEEAAQGEVQDAHAAVDLADSDPTATVSYGAPVEAPHSEHPPHESPWIMVLPILALAGLATVAGVINLPFTKTEFFDDWLEPTFRKVPLAQPTSFVQGLTLEIVSVVLALIGIGIAYSLYRRGLARAAEEPLDAKLGPVATVFGHAYYYDEGVSKFVDGPGRGFARWLDRVVDQKIIDGTVDGIGGLVKRAAIGLRHVQDGLVRRYALGVALGAAALLLYVVIRTG